MLLLTGADSTEDWTDRLANGMEKSERIGGWKRLYVRRNQWLYRECGKWVCGDVEKCEGCNG